MKKLQPLLVLLLFIGTAGYAQTKFLFGSTTTGGSMGYGTLVQGDSDGTNFHTVYNYDETNGSYPIGKMAQAGNGKVYVVTELGGTDGSCTVGTYDPETCIFEKIHDFMDDATTGAVPVCGSILGADGKVYGTTASGGLWGTGVIFSIDPTSNVYTDVYDFDTTHSTGYTEVIWASNNLLYGVGLPGYTLDTSGMYLQNGPGFIYSFDPTTSNYNIVHSFDINYGSFPNGVGLSASNSWAQQGLMELNGKIYGSTVSVTLDSAIIYSYQLSNGAYTEICRFSTDSFGVPLTAFVDGGNGKLYGATGASVSNSPGGGVVSFNNANIYSIDLNTNTFNVEAALNTTTGINPMAAMSKWGADKLMFTTTDGGAYGLGAIVTYDLNYGLSSVLFDFDGGTTGSAPMCQVLQGTKALATKVATAMAAVPTLVDVYPNPSNSNIFVQNAQSNTNYIITNMAGQQVMKGIVNSSADAIDISKLAAGLYSINNVKFTKE